MSGRGGEGGTTFEGGMLEELLVILADGPRNARSLAGRLRSLATQKRPAPSLPLIYDTLPRLVAHGWATSTGAEQRCMLTPVGRSLAQACIRLRQLRSAITTTPEQLAAARAVIDGLLTSPSAGPS